MIQSPSKNATKPTGKGIFIAIEGIDGSGKSTQAKMLADLINQKGLQCMLTMEPTQSPIGKLLRQYLSGCCQTDSRAIAALFAADRMDHILDKQNGLRAQLDKGYCVVSDRYYLSSLAYQGVDVDEDWLFALNEEARRILKPDIHILIDIPPKLAISRLSKRQPDTELYENIQMLRAVRDRYHHLLERFVHEEVSAIIDGCGTAKEVHERVWHIVSDYMT